jgi:hypothetical protein
MLVTAVTSIFLIVPAVIDVPLWSAVHNGSLLLPGAIPTGIGLGDGLVTTVTSPSRLSAAFSSVSHPVVCLLLVLHLQAVRPGG